MPLITLDDRELKELETDLKLFSDKAVPIATKFTLNGAAFKTQEVAKKRISRGFILRNRFTTQSIQFEATKTLNINRQEAVVGSTVGYMETQEFGGVVAKKGKHGVALPTTVASGEGEDTQPRRKLPTRSNKLAVLQLRKRRRRPKGQPKNNKQALLFKVQDSIESGKRVFYHRFGNGTKGIFRVKDGRKGSKRGWPKGAKIFMIYDLSEPSVAVPRRSWLLPSVEIVEKLVPGIYVKALRFQIERHRLFKG